MEDLSILPKDIFPYKYAEKYGWQKDNFPCLECGDILSCEQVYKLANYAARVTKENEELRKELEKRANFTLYLKSKP